MMQNINIFKYRTPEKHAETSLHSNL